MLYRRLPFYVLMGMCNFADRARDTESDKIFALKKIKLDNEKDGKRYKSLNNMRELY